MWRSNALFGFLLVIFYVTDCRFVCLFTGRCCFILFWLDLTLVGVGSIVVVLFLFLFRAVGRGGGGL